VAQSPDFPAWCPARPAEQLLDLMAEGEGFEPPKALRPGGFQVPETTGTIKHYRTPLATISGLWTHSLPEALPDGTRWWPMVLAQF
jgi:hypothetical protein